MLKWFILGPLELLMFNSPKKQLDLELEIKLNGEHLYQTDSVKHLRTHIDKTLIYKYHVKIVAIKLNKEMLCYRK